MNRKSFFKTGLGALGCLAIPFFFKSDLPKNRLTSTIIKSKMISKSRPVLGHYDSWIVYLECNDENFETDYKKQKKIAREIADEYKVRLFLIPLFNIKEDVMISSSCLEKKSV